MMRNKDSLVKPGYKMTSLGEIPEDWEVSSWGKSCSKILDGTHFSPISKDGTFKYITSKNIRNEGLDLSNVSYISQAEHKEIFKRCPVVMGDILLTKDGAGTGNCCINSLNEEFSLLSSVAVLRGDEKNILTDYLYQYIKSHIGQNIIEKSVSGQAITRITLEKIRAFKIIIPTVTEQKAIAEVLSTWDRAIEKTQELIEQKELRKKALMQQLLTGKKRLEGFSGEWKEVKIGSVFNEILSTNNGGDHEVMTISSRRGFVSQNDKFNRVIAGDSLNKYKLIKKYDFAYNKGNSNTYKMGCIYRLENQESAIIPFVYICFRSTSKVCSSFYKHWFLAYGLDRQLKKIISSGARSDGLLNVNSEDFFNLKVIYPELEEQTVIAEILQKADQEITLEKQKLEQLKLQKKGLMQVLLTGKKRISYENN